jgi:hypothetical protein
MIMEAEPYLEETTDRFYELLSNIRQQCHIWKPLVVNKEKAVFECDVSIEDRRALILQLFKEHVCTCRITYSIKLTTPKGRTIAKWAPGFDRKNSVIRGPFRIRRGDMWSEWVKMLVLPLPHQASDLQAQEPQVTLQEVKRNKDGELEWDDGQRPIKWQPRSPIMVLGNEVLVLKQGDIMYVLVEIVQERGTVAQSQELGMEETRGSHPC